MSKGFKAEVMVSGEKKPIHYRPSGRVPRCLVYLSASHNGKVEILRDRPRLTTDIARTTCSECLRYIADVRSVRL